MRIEQLRWPLYAGASMDPDGTPLVQIVAAVAAVRSGQRDAWPRAEWLWARPLGEDLFRVRSIPVVATGVSFYDVVRCSPSSDPPLLEALVERGGHRTVQIVLAPGAEGFELPQLPLDASSAAWMDAHHVAVDVHPEEDWASVTACLDALERVGTLAWRLASARPIATMGDEPR
jgi:hypothetical protein